MRKMSETRREAILDAAAQEFSACGYERASIAAIAARIGASKPTIYRYFPSKEELFAAVTNRNVRTVMAAADAALMEGQDLVAALLAYGERFLTLRQSPETIELTRLAFGESGRSDLGRLIWCDVVRGGLETIGGVLAAAMEEGKLRSADRSAAASHLFALLEAEIAYEVVLRVREPASPKEIRAVVARAIEAFIGAYHPALPPLDKCRSGKAGS